MGVNTDAIQSRVLKLSFRGDIKKRIACNPVMQEISFPSGKREVKVRFSESL
jgi:hypothetical protein